jgi:hypothetical protein
MGLRRSYISSLIINLDISIAFSSLAYPHHVDADPFLLFTVTRIRVRCYLQIDPITHFFPDLDPPRLSLSHTGIHVITCIQRNIFFVHACVWYRVRYHR